MARSRAHVREAEFLQQLAHVALVIGDAETIRDDALQIDAPPAHHAVNRQVRSRLDNLREFGLLFRRQARRGAAIPGILQSVGAILVEACTQSRSVWRSMPPIRAASSRLIPSMIPASDNKRLLWLTSFAAFASRRSATAE